MTDRMELNEQDLESVVGGAFRFKYDSNGDYLCKVDGVGIFHAAESAKSKIIRYDMNNPGKTASELVSWAKSQGLLW